MDVVELFLLFLVAFSVSFFLVIDLLESSFKKPTARSSQRVRVEDEGEDDLGSEIREAEEESTRVEELGFKDGDSEGEEEGAIEDDWEGVERSELEKLFGEAVVFVSCHDNAEAIAMVKMDLYGLQQVALQGPCHRPQPLPFNIPARSKWNAWRRLGDMRREVAMEMYIETLSKAIPEWKIKCSAVEDETLVKQSECTIEGRS